MGGFDHMEEKMGKQSYTLNASPCGAGWSTVQCPVSSCVFLMASSDVLGVGCRFDLIDNMF